MFASSAAESCKGKGFDDRGWVPENGRGISPKNDAGYPTGQPHTTPSSPLPTSAALAGRPPVAPGGAPMAAGGSHADA